MIAIIDYQMGNLRSVQKGFEKVGHEATVTCDPRQLAQADKVVLPGVGAFGDAMAELKRRHLVEPIREAVASGKPPHHLLLGNDAFEGAMAKLNELRQEFTVAEAVARGADFPKEMA